MKEEKEALTDEEERKILIKNFGILLRKQMSKRDMRVGELAKNIGATSQSISRYLSGKVIPGIITLIKMSEALDCKIDDLVSLKPVERNT